MTKKEQNERKKMRSWLRQEGLLPQPKQRLERKKFIDEAVEEWTSKEYNSLQNHFLAMAACYMTCHTERGTLRPSLEAVGAAKVLKIALLMQQYEKECDKQNKPWSSKEISKEMYALANKIMDM